MKCLELTVVCLVLAAVRAEEQNQSSDGLDLSEKEDKIGTSEKRWIQDNQSAQVQPSKLLPELSLQTETKGQERAKEEKTFKDFLGYEAIQSVLLNALKPKPVLDTAEENEKWAPNDGSTAEFLGNIVVRGTETLSRALNTVIDGPKKVFRTLSAEASQALNQLGAYIVGL